MTTSKHYDLLNRLTAITNTPSGSGVPAIGFAYEYNSANQRTSVTNVDGSFWSYAYDSLGQVTSGRKYCANGTPVLGQQFDNTFDDIGNRKSAVTGGDQWGANKRYQNYTANLLNQYTSRTVPGFVDIVGTANSNATVTLWSADSLSAWVPTTRQGEYFRGELAFDNQTSPIWTTITNLAVLQQGTNADLLTKATGNVFLPQTPEQFAYDSDGNLTNDGRWRFTWDGENRLVGLESLPGAPEGSKRRLTFQYDPQGRRILKAVQAWTNSTWTIILSNRFVYDGWNLIAELNATNNALIRSYAWGLDLSGTEQGAGGVGGLLAIRDTQSGTHFAACDGNGNVAALVNANDGTVSATYEYGPFAEPIRVTGPMGKEIGRAHV